MIPEEIQRLRNDYIAEWEKCRHRSLSIPGEGGPDHRRVAEADVRRTATQTDDPGYTAQARRG